jgi:hypothetical protein
LNACGQTNILDEASAAVGRGTSPEPENSFDLEDPMNERTFTNPVLLKAGKDFIQKVSCLDGALDFLYDWPEDRRGMSHATALRACQRALEGDYPLWFARDAFAAFAKWGKMLDDVSAPPPWMIDASAGQGDLPA